MNRIRDHNSYFDHGGYPPSVHDEARRLSKAKAKGLKRESNDENTSRGESGREQRPTKFPFKNELDVILRKVRSVLNKISALNYSKLQKRWENLIPTEQPDQLKEILQLLLTKALCDPMYMQIYARLAKDLLSANPSDSVLLRGILCNQIHHELQNSTTDVELAKFEGSGAREDAARRRRVMIYRFIAELFLENVCSTKFVTERVTDLICLARTIPTQADEPLECLCVLLMFAGSKLEEFKGVWLDDVFVKLNLSKAARLPIVSKRMQFMLLDLLEMRANGWTSQNKWWVPPVRISDTDATIDVELNNLKAVRSYKRGRKNNSTPERYREKTVRAILNQVVPSNVERMTVEFGRILKKKNCPESSAESIVQHILQASDPLFIRIQSVLLSKVFMENPLLKSKLIVQLFKTIKENPDSVPAVRFCTELYILGIVSLGEIISTLQKNRSTGVECGCVFFHRAQFKLYRDWRNIKRFEKMKIDAVLESMARNAQNDMGFRIRCMVLDIHDLRRKNWECTGSLLWNQIGLSHRTEAFTVENAINAFRIREEDGLEFMQENLGTDRAEIEKFVETMCIWAIWSADVRVLESCGRYVKAIKAIRLLTARSLHPLLGSLVQTVTLMKNKPEAWVNLGVIMREIYGAEAHSA